MRNTHKYYEDLLPLFTAGQVTDAEQVEMQTHLATCTDCQAALGFWQSLSDEITASDSLITAPVNLPDRALKRIHVEETSPRHAPLSAPLKAVFQRAASLLRAQSYLVKREMWPTSATIMALGVIVALFSSHVEAITFIAPLIAAASLAMLHGPEYDPAYELVHATPTSPWKILLARLSVVSAYNLFLALMASLLMLLIIPPDLLGVLILGWLAPMAFLSTLALLLSLWIGASYAIMLSYGLWMIQFVQVSKILESWGFSSNLDAFLTAYRSFWQSPGLLLVLSTALLGIALFSARFTEHALAQTPA